MSKTRTLITGDAGFVGQHAMAGVAGAVGLSSLGTKVDIRDKAALVACLREVQPTAVLHLAALDRNFLQAA